jgi:hypothetical protein
MSRLHPHTTSELCSYESPVGRGISGKSYFMARPLVYPYESLKSVPSAVPSACTFHTLVSSIGLTRLSRLADAKELPVVRVLLKLVHAKATLH